MGNEAVAIAQLLADPDPGVATALRKQLVLREVDPPGLREAVEALADPADRSRAREARLEIGRDRAAERLVRLAAAPDPDLEAGAVEVARLEDPDADLASTRRALDELAARTREAIRSAGDDARARLGALGHHLGEVEGFTGDRTEEEIPRSSSLPLVLERRRGLPIALSVVYLLVARRLEVPLVGIGAPLHFIVAGPIPLGVLYLDPFDRGKLLEVSEVAAMLRGMGVVFRAEHLAVAGTKAILARMARNLVPFHARRPRGEGRARRYARVAMALEPAEGA